MWKGKYNGFFKKTIKETELMNKNYKFYYPGDSDGLLTKPPMIYFENYDTSDDTSSVKTSRGQCHPKIGKIILLITQFIVLSIL